MAVKKITNHNEALRLKMKEQVYQPLQIVAINMLRHGHAGLTEMASFSEMEVSHDQCFFFLPKNSPVGGEP